MYNFSNTSRQYCRDLCKQFRWDWLYLSWTRAFKTFHWISNSIEISLVGRVPRTNMISAPSAGLVLLNSTQCLTQLKGVYGANLTLFNDIQPNFEGICDDPCLTSRRWSWPKRTLSGNIVGPSFRRYKTGRVYRRNYRLKIAKAYFPFQHQYFTPLVAWLIEVP